MAVETESGLRSSRRLRVAHLELKMALSVVGQGALCSHLCSQGSSRQDFVEERLSPWAQMARVQRAPEKINPPAWKPEVRTYGANKLRPVAVRKHELDLLGTQLVRRCAEVLEVQQHLRCHVELVVVPPVRGIIRAELAFRRFGFEPPHHASS